MFWTRRTSLKQRTVPYASTCLLASRTAPLSASGDGCILADSVGLGKTFTALAVIKYYELRNKSVLVLCPKKLADNWLTYKGNLKNNPLLKDRLCFDVLCHTDLLRDRGESLGLKLNRVNWSNYDLVVIDESHNFRNDDAFKDRETRYQYLMNKVIKQGVQTKVLMLSATPVNNRFNDLKNQLALAYEGEPQNLSLKLKATRNVGQRHSWMVTLRVSHAGTATEALS